MFAHGSGSSRHSPRNRMVASTLNDAGIGTLLVDLLTSAEERVDRLSGDYRFDVDLLAPRLGAIVDWLRDGGGSSGSIGLFGASTGAAAALVAAAERPADVAAVVSRGGRPDLAGHALARVRAATLLIVGQADEQMLELNRRALAQVARLAVDWFSRHLADPGETATHPTHVREAIDGPR